MLKDYIELSKGFQSSVNIEYDFNDISKINGFIPTTSALDIIVNIISNTENDKLERAKILTGAYGRGKSHIILIALSVLYNKDTQRTTARASRLPQTSPTTSVARNVIA